MKRLFKNGLAVLLALMIMISGAAYVLPAAAAESDIPEWADVDADGSVTVMDATYIQRWLAELPCPEGIGKPT